MVEIKQVQQDKSEELLREWLAFQVQLSIINPFPVRNLIKRTMEHLNDLSQSRG
jgi:hypothetical protein